MKLVLATWNSHKVHEVRDILADHAPHIEVLSLADVQTLPEAPETGSTFVENALQKAHFVYKRLGGVVVADDSGLEVDALDGAPGVHSKRYTPEATASANNARLVEALDGVTERSARFRCVMAVVCAAGEATAAGSCEGTIATEESGSGGFGYDPLFVPEGWGNRTLAQAAPAEKHAISHRGRAFRQLPETLKRLGLLP